MVNFNDNSSIDPAQVRLDDFAYEIVTRKSRDLGYPTNQKSLLVGFYKWLWGSGLNLAMVNNAGDPFDGKKHSNPNALEFEHLPFSEHRNVLNRNIHQFDSIAISGHKYFGMDEPAGLFITSMEVKNNQNPFSVSYLNASMPMINCSRSALSPLKLWWIIKHTSVEEFEKYSSEMIEGAKWLKDRFDSIGWPAWLEPMSNTVYFKRPSPEIVEKYDLAPDYDERLGGELSHIVVMQHVSKERLGMFIEELSV